LKQFTIQILFNLILINNDYYLTTDSKTFVIGIIHKKIKFAIVIKK